MTGDIASGRTVKIFLKALAKQFSGSIDSVLSILIVPIAYLFVAYRRLGAAKLPKTTQRLKRIGVFPLRNHYYEPQLAVFHIQNVVLSRGRKSWSGDQGPNLSRPS